MKRTNLWRIALAVIVLAAATLACTINTGGGGGSQPETFVGGDCEAGTTRIEMNASASGYIAGGSTFEQVIQNFCLWVPDNGSRLRITITGYSVDLDMYVDTSLASLMSESGMGQWNSRNTGSDNEEVTIDNPGGRYYIQIVSYDGSPSSFTISSTFTP
jgi:hypothetical protein